MTESNEQFIERVHLNLFGKMTNADLVRYLNIYDMSIEQAYERGKRDARDTQAIKDALEKAYDSGYQKGYSIGFAAGEAEGYEEGYDQAKREESLLIFSGI